MQVLRPFQQTAIGELRGWIRFGSKRLLLVAPTGAGKTTIAAAMIHSAIAKGSKILFLAHRKELIDQASARLDGLGVDHGIIMANHWRDRSQLPVQVASVQTVIRRDLPFIPDIVIIDEAHRAAGRSYVEVVESCGSPVVIGLTATPIRADGKGLGGELFHRMVQCPQIGDLIQMGYLVPPETYSYDDADLSRVAKRGGDYDIQQLDAAVNKPKLVGSVVEHWKELASDRRTVVFAVSINHSKAIRDEFVNAGIAAEHLDGSTPKHEREGILRRLADGDTQVVVNCAVLTEGWDCPVVSCCVIARPTLSTGLYLQMAGRALRTHPGKSDCLIIDHGGCCLRLGLVTSKRNWSLTEDRKKTKSATVNYAEDIKVCPDCGKVHDLSTLSCECGYVFSRRDKEIKHEPGKLRKITEEVLTQFTEAQRRKRYENLLYEQHTKSKRTGEPYSKGYAFMKYKAEFGDRPKRGWRFDWERENEWLVGDDRARRSAATVIQEPAHAY
jgi:DNA repair protein RadD